MRLLLNAKRVRILMILTQTSFDRDITTHLHPALALVAFVTMGLLRLHIGQHFL